MAHIVVVCLAFLLLPVEILAVHFSPMPQRVAAKSGLRTTAAIQLTTPSHSNLDTSSSEATELAPSQVDLGRRQQATPMIQSVPGASYLGCWVDSPSRIVGAVLTSANDMTPVSCRDFCSSRSYRVFGVEAAAWCLCDSTISSGAVRTSEADCSERCYGNAAVVCGANWRINIYSQTSLPSSTSSGITPSRTTVTLTPPHPNSPSVAAPTIQPSSSSPNVTAVGVSPGGIAGIAIGGALGIAAVAILVVYLLFILPRKRSKQSTTVHELQHGHLPEVQDLSMRGAVQELPGAGVAQELQAN